MKTYNLVEHQTNIRGGYKSYYLLIKLQYNYSADRT